VQFVLSEILPYKITCHTFYTPGGHSYFLVAFRNLFERNGRLALCMYSKVRDFDVRDGFYSSDLITNFEIIVYRNVMFMF
jgi:hypothetical protein